MIDHHERRRHPRTACDTPGTVVVGKFVFPCVVRDQSSSGARIAFDRPIYVSGAAELSIGNVLAAPIRTVWRTEREMGVSFE